MDFIGQANKQYNFEEKFAAMLSQHSQHAVRGDKGLCITAEGLLYPAGKKASEVILANIRRSFGDRAGLIARIESFTQDSGLPLSLKNFIGYYHLDPRSIYGKFSFSRLCADAGVLDDFIEPAESILTKAFSKLVAVDSRRWIKFLTDILPRFSCELAASLSDFEKRMLQMFYITVFQEAADWRSHTTQANMQLLADSPIMMHELNELLSFNLERIDFIDQPVPLGFDCPLDLHCTYTRDQILIAMDYMTPKNVREGVKWLPDKQVDVFFITLNKADKDYSPDYHVQRLFDQRKPVPLAKSKHDLRYGKHRSALYQPPAARQQGRSLCAGVQAGQHWRCTVYLSWNGSLCEAHRQQANEYYMASGPADSGEVSSQDEQAGSRIRKAFYENNPSRRRSHS